MNYKSAIEYSGMFAIIASLVFVGLELRQSQKIAIASQYQIRSATGQEHYVELQNNKYQMERNAARLSSRIWPEGFLSDEDIDWLAVREPMDLALEDSNANINLFIFDNYHYQYQSGFLSDEAWISIRVRLKGVLSDGPFARSRVMYSRGFWRSSFIDLCLILIDELEKEVRI